MNKALMPYILLVLKIYLINSTPTDDLWRNVCRYRHGLIERNIFDGANIEDRSNIDLSIQSCNRSINQATLLITAAVDDPRSTRVLLRNNADVNAVDQDGNLAIHWAATYGCLDAIRLLKDYRSPLDIENYAGETPLFLAVSYNNYDVSKFLVDHGVNIKNIDLYPSYLYLACKSSNDSRLIKLFINKPNINLKDDDGYTPLHIASENNNFEAVKVLLKYNANVNNITLDNNTPLHIAVFSGNEEVVKVLLTVDHINLNIKDEDGNTPLDIARSQNFTNIQNILRNYLEIVRVISKGAVKIKNNKNGNKKVYKEVRVPESIAKTIASFI